MGKLGTWLVKADRHCHIPVSYTHLDVYKRHGICRNVVYSTVWNGSFLIADVKSNKVKRDF